MLTRISDAYFVLPREGQSSTPIDTLQGLPRNGRARGERRGRIYVYPPQPFYATRKELHWVASRT